jgi:hypothetical protein
MKLALQLLNYQRLFLPLFRIKRHSYGIMANHITANHCIKFLFTKSRQFRLFIEIEQMPTFPSKSDSLWSFLESNFRYDILNSGNDTTKYFIRFNRDTLGTASDFEIIRTQTIPLRVN